MRDRRGCLGIAGIAVTRGYQNPRGRQSRDHLGGGHFRCQRQHSAPAAQAAQKGDDVVVQPPQMFRIVHTAACPVQEWPLDVNAERAGPVCIERSLHRGDGLRDGIEIIADQRRQESGGAVSPMRSADRADRFEARVIVE